MKFVHRAGQTSEVTPFSSSPLFVYRLIALRSTNPRHPTLAKPPCTPTSQHLTTLGPLADLSQSFIEYLTMERLFLSIGYDLIKLAESE